MAGSENIEGAQPKGRAIFISYRRDDTEGESGRLFDDLVRAYGDDSVFMDVTGIQPGLDFRKAIDDNVAGCGVLLAIIGPRWATITGRDGTRRLDNPNDFLRLEIASALKRGIPVIPVLMHEAHMPELDQLPEDLKELRYRNSVEVTHARWNSDVTLLVAALKSYVVVHPIHPEKTVHANLPVQLPAPQGKDQRSAARSKNLFPLGIVAVVVLVAIAGVLVFFHMRHSAAPASSPQAQTPTQTQSQKQAEAPAEATTLKPAPVQAPRSSAAPAAVAAAGPSEAGGANESGGPGAETALLGTWQNLTEPGEEDDLKRLSITDVNGQLMVEGWGNCPKAECHWRPQKAMLEGTTAVTPSFNLTNLPIELKQRRSVKLSIQPSDAGVTVRIQNTYHMPGGETVQGSSPRDYIKVP